MTIRIHWIVLACALAALDPAMNSQTVVGSITRPNFRPTALAVYEAGNKVFVADDTTKKIYTFDGVTHAELGSVPTDGGVVDMVVHEASGKLYALSPGTIRVIDAIGGALVRTLPGYSGNALALDPSLGKLYAAMTFLSPSTAGGLRQIDVASDLETTVPGVAAWQVVVNPVTHEVFATGNGGSLHIVDGSTLSVTTVPFAGVVRAVNWLENKVYSGWGTNSIYNRNANTATPIGIGANQNDASYLAFNPIGNRMYTGIEIDGWTTIIEGPTDSTWNLRLRTTAAHPPAVLRDTNHVYFPGVRYTVAVDDASQMFRIIPIDNPNASGGGILVQAIAANQKTGRVYTVNDWRTGSVAVLQDTPWRCNSSISPTSAVIPSSGNPAANVSVTTPPECSWTVAETASHAISDGGSPLFSTDLQPIHAGSGTTAIVAWPNNSPNPRTGAVKIAGQLFTVRQASTSGTLCTYSISQSRRELSPDGGTGSVTVTAAAGCGWWVSNTPGWIRIASGDRGFDGGMVSYVVAANPDAADREATIAIAEQQFTIVQAGTGPAVSAVADAASYVPGAVAPGNVVTVYGAGMGPDTIQAGSLGADDRLATRLAEASILFDDIPAPLIYASTAQSSAVVPFAVAGRSTTRLVAEYRGRRSTPLDIPVTATKPALFTIDASGTGQGSILNEDLSVNRPPNPVTKGSYVLLYGTGMGQTAPPGVDGQRMGSVLPRAVAPVSVMIDGVQTEEPSFAGGAPGTVTGVFQIRVRVPENVRSGNLPVVVTIGGASSQPGVTVAVR